MWQKIWPPVVNTYQRRFLCKMSRFEDLKASFKQRLLTAARKHLFAHLETTVSGYEKELDRKRKLLQMITKRRRADVQQVLGTKEEVPAWQQWDSSLSQKEPEPSHIKEQQTNSQVLMDCGESDSQLDFDNKASDFSEADSDKVWEQTDRKFNCPDCGKSFKQRTGLKIHMRTHTGEKPFTCSVCGKGFAQRVSLRYHMNIHTGEKPFSCSVCGRSFRQQGTLKIHMLTHTGEEGFGCAVAHDTSQVCEKRKKLHNCSECGETFPNSYLLVTHMRMHKGKKLFTCTVCGIQRQFRSQLDIHMRRHTGERPYKCSICGKTFTQRGIMMQHTAVHSGVKPYGCSKCNRRFYWHFQIKKHKCGSTPVRQTPVPHETDCSRSQPVWNLVLNMHSKQDGSRKTPVETDDSADVEFWKDIRQHQSGFTYQRKNKVSLSDARNSEKKPFSCTDDKAKAEAKSDEDVDSSFREQSRQLQSGLNSLKNQDIAESDAATNSNKKQFGSAEGHGGSEERHTLQTQTQWQIGQKPFSCLFCGKEFTLRSSLTRHISLHTKEKLHRCVVCEKRFPLVSELKSHNCVNEVLQVPAKKLFSCSQCHKRFGRKQQLLVHMGIHKAESRLSCSVCGKLFSKRQSLSSHMTCHTEENSICCSVCNEGFSDKESLIQHMRMHTRQTQFSCLICGKEFAWRRNLAKHMDVHAKEKNSSSRFCDSKEGEFLTSSSAEQTEPDESNDSDFRQETTQQQPESRSTGNGVWESNTGSRTDRTSDPQSDDSDSRRRPSHLNSVKQNDVCDAGGRQLRRVHRGAQGKIKQEDPDPPHIKEEQEEFCISQDRKQLQGLEGSDIKFLFSPAHVKGEDDEEKPQSSQLHHSQTEDSRDSVRGSELAGNSCPDRHLEQNAKCSDADSDDSDFWKETRKHRSVTNNKTSESGLRCGSDRKPLKWSNARASESLHPESDDSVDSDFWKDTTKPELELNSLTSNTFSERDSMKKTFSCSECGKTFLYVFHLNAHKKSHKEKPFFCSVCGQKCLYRSHLKIHMRTHTGEKPFGCPICGKKYAHKASMQSHMTVHTLNHSCSVCDKSFSWYTELKYHQCVAESSRDSESFELS